ncbi:MAG: hypothetical protein U0271_14305 [Polyangiaceae bacterium]
MNPPRVTEAITAATSPVGERSGDAAPDLLAFVDALSPGGKRPRPLRKLFERLAHIDYRGDMFEREEAVVGLADWIRTGGDVPAMPGSLALERGPVRRLRVLVEALSKFAFFRLRLSGSIQRLLRELSANEFFGKLGIPGDRGLLTETVDRLSKRLMPQPIDEQDITQLVARLFPRASDIKWLASVPPDLVLRLVRLLRNPTLPEDVESSARRSRMLSRGDLPLGAMPSVPDAPSSVPPPSRTYTIFAPLRASILEAILLLALRVSAAGLSDAIRARAPSTTLSDSPFFRLPRSIDNLLATPRHDEEEIGLWAGECNLIVEECRKATAVVFAKLEETGVSVDVVYRLELIDKSLKRIEQLVDILLTGDSQDHALKSKQLLVSLLEERRRHVSLTDIGRTTTRLLARKIIERAGTTGEHYITVTPAEFVKMFFSAAGGGVLTAGTTALKFFIGHLHRPPLQEGLLAGTNYAASFLSMQLCGFTLATKQPSMTAAALAGALKEDRKDHSAVVTIIARLVRSQLAAAAGNVLMVIPASIAFDVYWNRTRGTHLFDAEYAHKTLHSLHPTESGTLLFAAVTGVILWASSLAAGWLENWAVYRRIPEAIAEHRLRRIVGQRAMTWLSRFFARNIAGFGGNVAVGMMLGLVPIFATFAGAPLEVRHVTLSTGSVTYSVCTLGVGALSSPELKSAALGILCILGLNLIVSFTLAFGVALRAREVPFIDALRLFGAVLLGFFKSPARFFLPVEKGAVAATHH